MTQKRKRPIGLWLITLLQLIISGLGTAGISFVLLTMALQGKVLPHTGIYIAGLGYACCMAWVSIGLLRWKNWARVTTIVLAVVLIIITIALMILVLAAKSSAWVIRVPQLLYTCWVLWYLRRASIKAMFGPDALVVKTAQMESIPGSAGIP